MKKKHVVVDDAVKEMILDVGNHREVRLIRQYYDWPDNSYLSVHYLRPTSYTGDVLVKDFFILSGTSTFEIKNGDIVPIGNYVSLSYKLLPQKEWCYWRTENDDARKPFKQFLLNTRAEIHINGRPVELARDILAEQQYDEEARRYWSNCAVGYNVFASLIRQLKAQTG